MPRKRDAVVTRDVESVWLRDAVPFNRTGVKVLTRAKGAPYIEDGDLYYTDQDGLWYVPSSNVARVLVAPAA